MFIFEMFIVEYKIYFIILFYCFRFRKNYPKQNIAIKTQFKYNLLITIINIRMFFKWITAVFALNN